MAAAADFGVGLLVYSWIESISTEKTRAPSFASNAANGRPTTSDLDSSVLER